MNLDPRTARLLSVLTVAVFTLAPKPAAQEPQILSSADVKSLNKRARDWFEAWREYEFDSPSPRARRSNSKTLAKAKEAFKKDWDGRTRKGDPLASVADIRAVFDSAFPYERTNSSGIIKQVKAQGEVPGYWIMMPKRYDPERAYPTVILMPGFDAARGEWTDVKAYHQATWGSGGMVEDSLCMIPSLDAGLDFDPVPDFSQPGADAAEAMRLKAVLGATGQVQRDLNVDRERIVLDTGNGASGFALRVASYFPHRFAGLILRHPIDVSKDLRFGTLRGLPVLLVSSEETKDTCAALAAKLNELSPGACTVLEGQGQYPFKDSQAEIEAWTKDLRRKLTPLKLTLEPNHDAFNKAYWVLLGATDPLASLPMDQRPRFVVDVDREANRIKIESRGVADFMLLLNDDIVDLDKEFTVEVNGALMKEKRSRSLTFLVDRMQDQFDPSWIFTTQFATTVTKSDDEPSK